MEIAPANQIFMEDNVINAKMGLNFIPIVLVRHLMFVFFYWLIWCIQHVVVIPKDPMELLAAMTDSAGAKTTSKDWPAITVKTNFIVFPLAKVLVQKIFLFKIMFDLPKWLKKPYFWVKKCVYWKYKDFDAVFLNRTLNIAGIEEDSNDINTN